MENKRLGLFKIMGMVMALTLIVFGSMDNIWRTLKLAWNKVVKE